MGGKTIAEVKNRYDIDRISNISSNENRFGCSSNVRSAVEKALDESQDYPDSIARVLRSELANRNNADESEIIIAAGSESILSILYRSLLSSSDYIITADAPFIGIYVQGGVMGAEIKKVPVTSQYGFDRTAIL